MTRAQSFKALVAQSFMDRLALTTFTPRKSLNHVPSLQGPDPDLDDFVGAAGGIEKLLALCDDIKLQNA